MTRYLFLFDSYCFVHVGRSEHKPGYVNHTQRKPSSGVKTNITKGYIDEPLHLWPSVTKWPQSLGPKRVGRLHKDLGTV
jgi:hypothetical protein